MGLAFLRVFCNRENFARVKVAMIDVGMVGGRDASLSDAA
jgi:hypothetical protein